MKSGKVSVLINTFNEEKNIGNCLETVKWADEIVVVDMYSNDKTCEIAARYTESIYSYERMGYADPARQFALERATCEWILVVDADELVPVKMRDRLLKIIQEDIGDVVFIPHSNYYFGTLMKGGGWGPLQDAHPRFFKKNSMHFGERVHDFFSIAPGSRIYRIIDPREGFVHFNFTGIEHFLDKLNAYTSIEAKNIFEGKKAEMSLFKIIVWKGFGGLFQRLILQKGYKDGLTGLYVAFYRSFVYYFSVYIKLRIMRKYQTPNPGAEISNRYCSEAKRIINQYSTNL